MGGAESGAGVAVEVLVERDGVVPRRVGVEFLVWPVYRAPPVGPFAERGDEPVGEVISDGAEVGGTPGTGGVFDGEIGAEEPPVGAQGVDDEGVDREPHRAAPVGVAAEQ